MKKSDFIRLHMDLTISLPKTKECNPLKSATDPTQDIPLRMVEMSAMGIPTNVKELKAIFNNIKAENFTSIERRFNDKFDQLGELQEASRQVSKKGVTTNYKLSKKQKKHEE